MEEEDDDFGSLYDSRKKLEDSRDAAIDFTNEFYEEPEDVANVSDKMAELYDPASSYLSDAKEKSKTERSGKGYLDSGFNEGMGTVAAYDKAFDVAIEDTYSSMFNQNEINEANREQYFDAYDKSLSAMYGQGQLTLAERKHLMNKDESARSFDNLLTLMDKDFEYTSSIQEQSYDQLSDRLYYQFEGNKAMVLEYSKRQHENTYLQGYSNIISSDMRQEDKYDQLVGLADQTQWASDSMMEGQNIKISGSPYELSYVDTLSDINVGSKDSPEFSWDMGDALYVWEGASEIITKLDVSIHEQTNHQERNMYTPYLNLETVRDDFPNLQYSNPEAFTDTMEWYDRTAKYDLADDWEGVIRDWSVLTYEATHNRAVEAQMKDWDLEVRDINYNAKYTKSGLNEENTEIVLVSEYVYSEDIRNNMAWFKYKDCVLQGRWGPSCIEPETPDPYYLGNCKYPQEWDYQLRRCV